MKLIVKVIRLVIIIYKVYITRSKEIGIIGSIKYILITT